MAIRQLPSPRWTVPGNSGAVAAGYYVYTYQPGTSTPKATYKDAGGEVENTNPIVLDTRGEANIWWDGEYKVLVYTGDRDNGGVLVWSHDNYGAGYDSTLTGNFNLSQNGSFEIDTSGDGEPDHWTVTEYTGGAVSRDSTDQFHGRYALKFVSTGDGGGFATSDFFEVQEDLVYAINFAIKSSVSDIHNLVEVVWYTGAQAVISTTAVYDDDATNPTSWTYQALEATAPANARYGRVRVTGAKDDNTTSGTCWFDNVAVVDIDTLYGFRFPNLGGDVTASDVEINILDGATLSTDELNTLDGITAATAELNILDGATVSAAELNILDGATLSTSELNQLDGAVLGSAAEVEANQNLRTTDSVGFGGVAISGQDCGTIRALIQSDGTVEDSSNTLSGTFSVSHPTTGVYSVTHNFGTKSYIVQGTAERYGIVVSAGRLANSVNITLRDVEAAANIDYAFQIEISLI